MSHTHTLILTIGGLQGLLLFTLLVSDKRVNYAGKLLGFYCLALASTLILPLIVVAENTAFTGVIGFLLFLPSCYGGLSYLYCRSAITGSALTPRDVIHFLPLLLCYALNHELLFSAQKALAFVTTPRNMHLSYGLTLLIFYGQAFLYMVLIGRLIYHYQHKARETLSAYNPDTFKWHWSLIGFMVLIWCLKTLAILTSLGYTANVVADGILVVMIYFFAVMQWRTPGLFHIQQLEAQLSNKDTPKSKKPTEGALDQKTRSSVLQLVQNQVQQQALYRNSELTLAMLADQVGVNVHHLSETLNQHGGKNFNLFINEYRVAEVCQQLGEPSQRNLIDLAMDAGFSSKSSFNAIFKKITGKTPSVYRQQLALVQ